MGGDELGQGAGKPKAPLLPTTAEAIRLARTLLRTARSASLAVVEPDTGWPMVSRIGVATDIGGTPLALLSGLAAHTRALWADGRCSLLLGAPGKGDPLAHPRLSLFCEARRLDRGSDEARRAEFRYLSHQPKAGLYAGLGDFQFYALPPARAALNAGFGKAYNLAREDIVTTRDIDVELASLEPSAIEHMNKDHAEALQLYAGHFASARPGKWRLIGIDAEGIDLADGDDVRRVWFDTPLQSAAELRPVLAAMAAAARRAASGSSKS